MVVLKKTKWSTKRPYRKFYDDSKILAVIRDCDDANNLQKELSSIWDCSNDWLMQLNVSNCNMDLVSDKMIILVNQITNKQINNKKINKQINN